MKLIDFIEKLQEKPHEVRVRILWLAVFICMLIIFSLWLLSLKYSLKKSTAPSEENKLLPPELTESVKEMKKQMPTIKEDLGASLNNLFETQNQQNVSSPFENQKQEEVKDFSNEEIKIEVLPPNQ